MTGENCHRAIQLFASHHPDELVGPGHLAEAQHSMGHGAKRRVEPVRPADRDRIGRSRPSRSRPMSAAHSSLVADGPCSSSKTRAPPLGVAARIAAASSARLSSGRRERDSPISRKSTPATPTPRALRNARSNDRTTDVPAPPSTCRRKSPRGACRYRPLQTWPLLRADRRSTFSQGYRTGDVWTENVHDRILCRAAPITKRHSLHFR